MDLTQMMRGFSKPVAYTANPLWLLWNDIRLFLTITLVWPLTDGIPSIVLPCTPLPSGRLDELYPSSQNIYAIVLHFLLVVGQLTFLVTLIPSAIIGIPIPFYTPVYLGWIALFIVVNTWVSKLLNGKTRKFHAGAEFANDPAHKGEKWVFVNGVAVGQHWLQGNIDRLAKTFRRPILGIHNQTRGIIFDVIECMIQRDLTFATNDIRTAYEELAAFLSDDQVNKVVLILHSQGAIEGGIVLDWLFATLPARQVAKIEVYTFGNAANHWNSPIISGLDHKGVRHDLPTDAEQRVIKHIEHYANTGDYVSRFGILHFRPQSHPRAAGEPLSPTSATRQAESQNRFVGKLFKREGRGHQMNGNYLDNMFLMNPELTEVLENNPFMDSVVDEDAYRWDETVGVNMTTIQQKPKSDGRKIKEMSRLWEYRNGGVPAEP